jgi:hypothetical protein
MEKELKKTFATPDGCDLVVENVKGQILVEGWDRAETEVVAAYNEGADIEISQDGRKVIVRTKAQQNVVNGLLDLLTKGHNAFAVDYTVHVPHNSNLKLKNVNGPVSASQVRGKVKINNVDGPATLEAITGEAAAETVNGALKAAGLTGTAQLKTVNGKLQVSSGQLSELAADTVNGQIEIAASLAAEGHYTFNTVNGSCHLTLPADLRARVSAHGVNASVKCTQPPESIERHFGTWQGTIGPESGPTAEITFHTVNGSLRIDNGEPAAQPTAAPAAEPAAAPAPAPEPPEPPTTPVEVKVAGGAPATEEVVVKSRSQAEILQMVERGEITVDEAIKLLRGS